MITFTEHEKDPGFRQRAAALEPKLRAKIARDETIILGEIAAEVGVSLDVAGVWIALPAARMGERLQITSGGLSWAGTNDATVRVRLNGVALTAASS